MRPLLWLLLCCLLAACGGTATPVAPATSAPATSPSAVSLPPRPRTVDVSGVDPCALLSVEQRKQLGLDEQPYGSDYRSALYHGGVVRICTTVGRDASASVQLSTSGGIEVYTAGPIRGAASPLSVHGFPAIQATQTNHPEFCSVVVDVAAGQTVDVQFVQLGRDPQITQSDLCAGARQTAELAMTTLTDVLGR